MQAQYAITYLKVVQVRAELWRHWLEVDINVWDPVEGSDSGVRCVPTAPAALRHDGCVCCCSYLLAEMTVKHDW